MTTDPQLNPYESPRDASLPRTLDARTQLMWRLRGPSMGLLFLAGLQVVYLAVVAFVALFMIIQYQQWPGPPHIGQSAIALGLIVPSAFIVLGAIRMRQMRSLRLCRIAAIIACVPFLSPVIFLGIPFGIWAIIVLYMPSTAAQFDRPPLREPDGDEL